MTDGTYDVVIGGGGLAGLALGRQLKLRMPDLKIAIVDRLKGPLPDAAFKVGESTLAAGGYYFQNVLRLGDYLKSRQILKFGLRYFYPSPTGNFEDRPEFGRARYRASTLGDHGIPEWQVDRGRLETDLRAMNREMGIDILEGWSVGDVTIGPEGHQAHCRNLDGDAACVLSARWFIDAMGRRRFLQRKFNLDKPVGSAKHSSCWFRIKGLIDIESFVPPENREWHERVPGERPGDPEFGRYNSTNHLLGDGYWVWLIPLSTGATSVGVVVNEDLQPFEPLKSYASTLEWLARNEPEVARALAGIEPMDFKVLRNYAYSSHKVLSGDRWACTGEAGCFADPYYSPGSDSIGFMNCVICESIALDRLGRFDEKLAASLSAEFIDWLELYTETIQAGYHYFAKPMVALMKTMWDMGIAQATSHPMFFSFRYKEGFVAKRISLQRKMRFLKPILWALPIPDVPKAYRRGVILHRRMLAMLKDWRGRTGGALGFRFLELLDDNPVIKESYAETHAILDSPFPVMYRGLKRMESMALTIFLIAVEDALPGHLERLLSARALDPMGIGLDPARWETDGLFRPVLKLGKALEYRAKLRPKLAASAVAEKILA